jgi:YfiH family protein
MTITSIFPDKQVDCLVAGKTPDDTSAVATYLNRFKNRQLVRLNQQHTSNVLSLTKQNVRSQLNDAQIDLADPADAVLSDRSDVVLSVRTADCLPILLYHPSGIIGAIHAGRKGTDLGILKQTLQSLKAEWGVEKGVQLWFGPAICTDCYQVARDSDVRYDLRAKNKQQAESVYPTNSIQIIDSEHCTFHDNQHWYSYRREGAGVPMNYSYICLRANS